MHPELFARILLLLPSVSLALVEPPPASEPISPPPAQSTRPLSTTPDYVANVPGEVLVTLKDGQFFQGVLRSHDEESIVISIAGIETVFDVEKVVEVKPLRTFEEYYEDLRFSIPLTDAQERFRFCQWIYQRGRLSIARTELERLLDIKPGFAPAKALLAIVESESTLQQSSDGEGTAAAGSKETTATTVGDKAAPADYLITDEDVNLLKVYEINIEHPPRVVINRATIDTLFERYAESDLLPKDRSERERFYSRKPAEILDTMFKLQARDLYREVRVLSEPDALNRFRLDVHKTWLANSCATNECHGGENAGQFRLVSMLPTLDRTVFTNLLILDRLTIDGRPMINFDRAQDSLLLQSGLPREMSKFPHPPVPDWRPIFRDEKDSNFRKAVGWINAMYRPRPVYPIDLRVPWLPGQAAKASGTPTTPFEDTSNPPGPDR